MTSEKDVKPVLCVAAVLFIVGVLCYAAFPIKSPQIPNRIQYRSATGHALFEHKEHFADYGVECLECHHHYAEDLADEELLACGACHPQEPGKASDPEVCNECHDEEYYEDTEMVGRMDATHDQCKTCHAGIGAGPLECAECHLM
ncbi:MAG: cytochrome c3 family protein [Desulfobacterales bacterium]|nr:cytochrome c3 family protein [Desulfobacterales bacterium]MDJ0873737.1 cytochrome c3 family protein [Desulfobacterales bacterium]MDJ0883241.1 cytochrome c3 family protein [Desulfobacterales bacterium]